MGITALRQLLKSFCNNSCWKYAVFWKLKHQSPMLLTWEDGYCDYSKLGEPIGSVTDDIHFGSTTNKIFSPKSETSVLEGSSTGCPIALAVADMSYLQYALGEGVVGKVASTGNHFWCFSDDTLAGEFNSKLVSGCPDEWLLQFLGGIKTILLVPVVPHGVLQLGSLEKVVEDLALVAFVKDTFNTLQNDFSIPFTSSSNIVAQPSSVLTRFMEKLDDTSVATTHSIPKGYQYEDLKAVDNVQISTNQFSARNQVRPLFTVQDALQASGKDLLDILNGESGNAINVSSVDFMKVLTPTDANHLKMIKSKISEMSCPEEESQGSFQCNNLNVGVCGELSEGILKSYSDADMIEQLYGENNAIDADYTTMSSLLSFPLESELHKALGPAFDRWTDECMWDSSVTGEGACSSSNPIFNSDFTDSIGLSAWESSERSSKSDAENLLEAVVASIYSGLDDTLSERSNCIRSFETSLEQFDSPSEAQNQSVGNALLGYDSVPWSHISSTFVSRGRDTSTNSPATASSFKSVVSRLVDEQLQNNGYGSLQSRKGAKLSKVNKRKCGPVDSQRPRPRDRQMIQDRVKELRELVPNGAKCSIDGLLERTIKHMLFLRNVSDRAEKFRQWTHQEVADSRDWKSSETKGAGQNGTSWAFQLGSELEVCPIVVEDLEYPGHILIEMLCNEHGLFLEIAQVIRGLELTILEGKIESRSDSTWARFVVEVSSGFHRMDIFWPLMHLLQRNRHPISSKI